jgi:hypothetical protein
MSEIKNGQKWRHKERGSVYVIVDTKSRCQCSSIGKSMRRLLENELWVNYKDVRSGMNCFRMRDEFLDGRFELVESGDA